MSEEYDVGRFVGLAVAEVAAPYGDLTYGINGVLMRVHRELGPGLQESDYHTSAMGALKSSGFDVQSHVRGRRLWHAEEVGRFELDLLVNDTVIVELKHVVNGFAASHFIQVINYLTFWRKDVSLLVNFAYESLHIRRLKHLSVAPAINCPDGVGCEFIRDALAALYREGCGTYSVTVLNELFASEVRRRGHACVSLHIAPVFESVQLPSRATNAWLYDGNTVVLLSAALDGVKPRDRATLAAYMRHARLTKGVHVNIGNPTTIRPEFA